MAINILEAFEAAPPPMDFIWPGFLAGTVGALVAPGATGKSYWTLEAAISIACCVAGGDLIELAPQTTGKVIYLAGEDPSQVLLHRLHAIGQYLQPAARVAIAENLKIDPILGKRLNLMDTSCQDQLIAQATDTRLVVLDTLSRIHHLDENSNGDMARLISVLEYISHSTGAAILFLHHVNKGSVREGQLNQQQAARGASALVDNARWCGYLAKMTEEEAKRLSEHSPEHFPIGNTRRDCFLRFGISKQNYHSKSFDRWYERNAEGVLLPVTLTEAKANKVKHRGEI